MNVYQVSFLLHDPSSGYLIVNTFGVVGIT